MEKSIPLTAGRVPSGYRNRFQGFDFQKVGPLNRGIVRSFSLFFEKGSLQVILNLSPVISGPALEPSNLEHDAGLPEPGYRWDHFAFG